MKSPSQVFFVFAVLLLATLCACNQGPGAPIALASEMQPRKIVTMSHGEAVFRLQNLVMDNLITAQMSDPSLLAAERARLANLETGLIDACSSLNDAATTSAGGQVPGMVLQLRVLVSMDHCERSAVAAKAFMATGRPLLRASLP